jgi:chromosomal replication initiator protein
MVRAMTIQDIQKLVAAAFGVTVCDLLSDRRRQAAQRQVAMWLCRHTTPCSLPTIGRAFSRDHTTVEYAIKRVDQRMAHDAEFAGTILQLLGRAAA